MLKHQQWGDVEDWLEAGWDGVLGEYQGWSAQEYWQEAQETWKSIEGRHQSGLVSPSPDRWGIRADPSVIEAVKAAREKQTYRVAMDRQGSKDQETARSRSARL